MKEKKTSIHCSEAKPALLCWEVESLLSASKQAGSGLSVKGVNEGGISTKTSVSSEDKTQTPAGFHLSAGDQEACCYRLQGLPY